MNGIVANQLDNVTVGQIMRFRAQVNQQTRRSDNLEIYKRFNDILRERHLVMSPDGTNNSEINDNIVKPLPKKKDELTVDVSLIVKDQLISLIDQTREIYMVINDMGQWKKYFDHTQMEVKECFTQYCETSTKYKYLMELKALIEKWSDAYGNIMTFLRSSSNASMDDHELVLKQLSQKDTSDQLFIAEILKHLKIDEIHEQMERASNLFKTHYKMVNDVIQPLLKPNSCKICLVDPIDRFIDTCGHTLCEKCANLLLHEHPSYSSNTVPCPYCKKNFSANNLKKIFY